jgi:hypothetical protein
MLAVAYNHGPDILRPSGAIRFAQSAGASCSSKSAFRRCVPGTGERGADVDESVLPGESSDDVRRVSRRCLAWMRVEHAAAPHAGASRR